MPANPTPTREPEVTEAMLNAAAELDIDWHDIDRSDLARIYHAMRALEAGMRGIQKGARDGWDDARDDMKDAIAAYLAAGGKLEEP